MSTPNDSNHDEQFAGSAKTLFDDSVDRIDAATLSKLNRGRHAALAELSSTGHTFNRLRWMPATGVVAAAVIAVVMLQGPSSGDLPMDPASTVADFDILIGEESLDMIEHLEFYSWIDLAELDATDNVG